MFRMPVVASQTLAFCVFAMAYVACGNKTVNVRSHWIFEDDGGLGLTSGEGLYKDSCRSCHGEKGNYASGREIPAGTDGSDIRKAIDDPSNGMSALSGLTDNELEAIAAYLEASGETGTDDSGSDDSGSDDSGSDDSGSDDGGNMQSLVDNGKAYYEESCGVTCHRVPGDRALKAKKHMDDNGLSSLEEAVKDTLQNGSFHASAAETVGGVSIRALDAEKYESLGKYLESLL